MNNSTKEVTIYDIAKVLSVSPATVSRGLQDHPSIRKDTKKRILDMAKEMGYRHNSFARNLRQQRTNTIGVIVHRLNSYFVATVIAGMEKVANEAGYNLIISQSLESFKKEAANAKTMFNSRVDGLMTSLAYDTEDIEHFSDFIRKGIPVLFFDRVYDNPQCTSVLIDNYQAAYDVTTHLLSQGCKRIAHITGSMKRNVYSERLRGYQDALIKYNIPYQEELIIINELNEETGIEARKQILEMTPRPDGVFVSNDVCAAYCMRTLKAAGVSIPDDVAFAGFNNDPISRVVEPNLTTVNYPAYQMGEVAAQNMIHHLIGKHASNSTNKIIMRAEIVIRDSSLKSQILK